MKEWHKRIRFTYRGPFDSEATTGDLADQSPATGYGCAKSAEYQHNWSPQQPAFYSLSSEDREQQ
jgi:hypothetical protein